MQAVDHAVGAWSFTVLLRWGVGRPCWICCDPPFSLFLVPDQAIGILERPGGKPPAALNLASFEYMPATRHHLLHRSK